MSLAEHLRGKRFGVALSSSYFGFYGHAGFARALEAQGLTPALWSGASAGALVAAFAGAHALDALEEVITTLRRTAFWDPAPTWRRPLGLLRGDRFTEMVAAALPVDTFEACPTPVLTVSTNLDTRGRHVDTTGPIVPAVIASCALPVLFRPILRDGALHLDGGLFDKAPIQAMVAHMALDAIVVHVIPSSGLRKPVARAPWNFLDQALDWVRADSLAIQMQLAEALGVEIYLVESQPPPEARPNPFKLERGPVALDWCRTRGTAALAAPVATHRVGRPATPTR